MLGEVGMIGDRVECWWVVFRECWVCVLTVKVLLVSIDPNAVSTFHNQYR
jgi:hypothetical protein